MPFHCNIAYELRSAGMKTTHLSRLEEQVFVPYILQMFNEGTLSGPAVFSLLSSKRKVRLSVCLSACVSPQ
jgi:hypothetical protein